MGTCLGVGFRLLYLIYIRLFDASGIKTRPISKLKYCTKIPINNIEIFFSEMLTPKFWINFENELDQ
jgi:hypothetical protein